MLATLLAFLVASGPARLGAVELVVEESTGGRGSIEINVGSDEDEDAPTPPTPPTPPVPPLAPVAPVPPTPPGDVKLRRFSVHSKDAPAVDVLHRIAQSAGWSLTVAGVGDERISLDVTDVDPREAVRAVLRASRSWAVLRGDRLVVMGADKGGLRAGELIERRSGKTSRAMRRVKAGSTDMIHVFQGDLTIAKGP